MPNGIRTGLIAAVMLAALAGTNYAFAAGPNERPLVSYLGVIGGETLVANVANPLSDRSCLFDITYVDVNGTPVPGEDTGWVSVGPGAGGFSFSSPSPPAWGE